MIGKTEWFTYRIFGWGLRPKTKEGWIYVGAFVALFVIIAALPISEGTKAWAFGIVLAILLLDSLHMMIELPKKHDERANYHQLLIERNVSFAAVTAIVIVMLYQSIKAGVMHANKLSEIPFDKSLLIILLVMVAVKAVSTLYVWNKK